ncbi:MAG: hypothetical protein QOF30_327 [Acidimicrobiaceae bacterium]|nr:hypothetical protein [Acidimicrobiaceae bacterium]
MGMAAQRRKRGGRVTPKGGAGGRTGSGLSDVPEWMGLEDVFAKLVTGAGVDLGQAADPLAAEVWASQMWSVWGELSEGQMDPIELFAGGLIAYCAGHPTSDSLTVLRALAAVASEPYGSKARRAVHRVASNDVAEPAWAEMIGTSVGASAWLSFDPAHDDGVMVMVGFEGASGAHTLGVFVDHNLGGIAKDSLALPVSVDEVLARLREGEGSESMEYREISVAQAAARWRDAFKMTDKTLDPPVTEDLRHLRALLMARLSRMPAGAKLPVEETMSADERERLLGEFFDTDDAAVLFGPEGDKRDDVEQLAFQAMTFSLDHVRGTPLRFSPVMVEIFSLDWAPRKVVASEDVFTLMPDVLAAWIRFVGRRRGIPEMAVGESIAAVYDYAPEMMELCRNPANWGPAKTIVYGAQERGIDITDRAALNAFIADVNRRGGIDVLADSLASRR